MAAADVLYEVMTIMVKRGPLSLKEQKAYEERMGEEKAVGEGEGRRFVKGEIREEKEEM